MHPPHMGSELLPTLWYNCISSIQVTYYLRNNLKYEVWVPGIVCNRILIYLEFLVVS